MSQRPRRGRRRAPQRPGIDDDLSMLASVIAEYQLDNTAYGWFRPPWRDGLHAAHLALAAAVYVDARGCSATAAGLGALINLTIEDPTVSNLVYERAGQIYRELTTERSNTEAKNLLAVCARSIQLRIARSDANGTVYNELLIPAFLPLPVEDVADLVLEYRCLDALGTSHHLAGDRNDRQRAAFVIAWRRGLYLAAYSLPPAF